MTKTVFIGSTGTDIGKTYVTCMLLRQLRQQGFKVKAIKPIISGFDENHIEKSDTGQLLQAMGRDLTPENVRKISPWRFKDPLPPHLCAAQTNSPIIFDQLVHYCEEQADDNLDFLLIEGVGGIMVPVNYEQTTLDLIERLNCPCLLVVGSYLGTISHTLASITCINQRCIEIEGLVISESFQNYTKFDTILNDFTKIFPNISIKKIARNNQTEDIASLVI